MSKAVKFSSGLGAGAFLIAFLASTLLQRAGEYRCVNSPERAAEMPEGSMGQWDVSWWPPGSVCTYVVDGAVRTVVRAMSFGDWLGIVVFALATAALSFGVAMTWRQVRRLWTRRAMRT